MHRSPDFPDSRVVGGFALPGIGSIRQPEGYDGVILGSVPRSTASSDTLALPNFYPGTTGSTSASAAVTCSADPNTGAAGGLVPITGLNKPERDPHPGHESVRGRQLT
jgi:hypothetical protein